VVQGLLPGGRRSAGRAELIQYMLWGFGDPLADRRERGRSGQYGARCKREHHGEGVPPHSERLTGIRYPR
jgi:hypothetical protein